MSAVSLKNLRNRSTAFFRLPPAETLFAPSSNSRRVRLVHEPADGDLAALATSVDTADSTLAQMRGLMFRRSIPDDYALVFRFDATEPRDVHMLFVPFPLDVLWLVDDEVQRTERLSAWTGIAKADADTLVELPAGAADDVSVGDEVRLES